MSRLPHVLKLGLAIALLAFYLSASCETEEPEDEIIWPPVAETCR